MPLVVVAHPLVRHKMGILRCVDTSTSKFRELTREITCLLAYECFRSLEMEKSTVEGWARTVEVEKLSGKKFVVVPRLRAGLGMLPGVLDLIPGARINLVGAHDLEDSAGTNLYYHKLSCDAAARLMVILDPILATGNSLSAVVDLLKKVQCKDIRVLCLIAAPEGALMMEKRHPDVSIYVAALDEGLDPNRFVLPGLGDAGDRLFGTK